VVATSDRIKELRLKSGAPVVECKKALEHAEGDITKAMDWLREHGAAKTSSKLRGRDAPEGLVALRITADGTRAALVKVSLLATVGWCIMHVHSKKKKKQGSILVLLLANFPWFANSNRLIML
jgi:hypothetical protein